MLKPNEPTTLYSKRSYRHRMRSPAPLWRMWIVYHFCQVISRSKPMFRCFEFIEHEKIQMQSSSNRHWLQHVSINKECGMYVPITHTYVKFDDIHQIVSMVSTWCHQLFFKTSSLAPWWWSQATCIHNADMRMATEIVSKKTEMRNVYSAVGPRRTHKSTMKNNFAPLFTSWTMT